MYMRRKRLVLGLCVIVTFAVIFIRLSPSDTSNPTVATVSEFRAFNAATDSEEQIFRVVNEAPPESESAALVFGNGEWEEITWRGLDWSRTLLPPYGHQYDALHEQATSGDREAAYALFHILERCKYSYGSEEELDLAMESARNNMTFDVPYLDRPLQINNIERLEWLINDAVAKYYNCEPITTAQAAEADKWLLEAANGGPTDAMTYYASTLDDHDLAMEYLEGAWAFGSLSALDALGKMYLSQYESGAAPENDIKSYAAFYAFATLAEQGTIAHGHDATALIETHTKRLARAGATLTEWQIDQGTADALEMIRSNSNCCFAN